MKEQNKISKSYNEEMKFLWNENHEADLKEPPLPYLKESN